MGDDREAQAQEQILLVGGSPDNLQVLMNTLTYLGHRLSAARSGGEALEFVREHRPTLVLLDVTTSDIDGFEVCRKLKSDPETHDVTVVFCSALVDAASRVKGFDAGGADFISKPFQTQEVVARVRMQIELARARRELAERNERLQHELNVALEFRKEALQRIASPLIGSSPAIEAVRESIARLARNDETVLILAGADSGSEAVARAIHSQSSRDKCPFVVVDCALLHPSAETAVLRNSNSGTALSGTKLEMARGGTLFLDSVDRLGASMQAQLLDFLEHKQVRQGHRTAMQSDVRLIVSTSNDAGSFPSGYDQLLVQRLRNRIIRFPSLAERREDIPDLVTHWVDGSCRRLGRAALSVSPETMQELQRYSWPGNLKELEEVVTRAVRTSRGNYLQVDPRLLSGGIPLGDYRLIRKIGAGGMGEVWEATHHLIARPAAIKMVKPNTEDADALDQQLKRFEREARVTARLRSRNTIALYDFGVLPNGSFYYVMERLIGMDLEDIVNRFGPLPSQRVAAILHQATSSLGEAHGMGLVHRDIKPSNLFLCELGIEVDVLKVLDFGMVADSRAIEDTRLTKESSLCGTPLFMSPEAATGSTELTDKADIYSLGCVAYWLLTGTHVFEAPNPMTMLLKHISELPPPPSGRGAANLPQELESLVMRCLEKKPEARPSALELRAILEQTELSRAWTSEKAAAWWEANMPEADSMPRSLRRSADCGKLEPTRVVRYADWETQTEG